MAIRTVAGGLKKKLGKIHSTALAGGRGGPISKGQTPGLGLSTGQKRSVQNVGRAVGSKVGTAMAARTPQQRAATRSTLKGAAAAITPAQRTAAKSVATKVKAGAGKIHTAAVKAGRGGPVGRGATPPRGIPGAKGVPAASKINQAARIATGQAPKQNRATIAQGMKRKALSGGSSGKRAPIGIGSMNSLVAGKALRAKKKRLG